MNCPFIYTHTLVYRS